MAKITTNNLHINSLRTRLLSTILKLLQDPLLETGSFFSVIPSRSSSAANYSPSGTNCTELQLAELQWLMSMLRKIMRLGANSPLDTVWCLTQSYSIRAGSTNTTIMELTSLINTTQILLTKRTYRDKKKASRKENLTANISDLQSSRSSLSMASMTLNTRTKYRQFLPSGLNSNTCSTMRST